MRRGTWAGLPRRRAARWPWAAASGVAHALLLLLALDVSRKETDALWRRIDAAERQRPPETVPLYVPLPPPPPPVPAPEEPEPRPPEPP
ncbi:MAG TPA: hypothetical protein VFU46_12335, partial [Gemmatimonadales bacterium]|nr:hypothetical protein [Gemmatimonadales bacterium]